MKQIILLAAIFSIVAVGCQEGGGSKKKKESKNISSRDYSITKENAYSTLFLDSTAMEKFIAEKQVPDSIARRMRSFYNTRNFQYAWFSEDGLTEQARAFWNLHDYVTTYDNDTMLKDKSLQKTMDGLIARESLRPGANEYINTELKLTEHFILYMLNTFEKGYVKRKEMERFIPYKKADALTLGDSLYNKKHNDNKYFEDVHERYRKLKEYLGRYIAIVKNGGWPQVPENAKSMKKGGADSSIAILKKRLQISGELPQGDTSAVYNDTLANAIMIYQKRMGYTPDGKVTAQLIKDLNVPAEKRLQQILINMGRMRWMPPDVTGKLIVVNIPEFVLHIYENNKRVMDMDVVVGKEGHNTVVFTGDLSTIVFSPYWNVPPSIVKNEILPAMESNPGYLESHNMEINGEEGGLPSIRQRPGGQNSLGKVKFLFPNSFNIYFHDTPAKSLFEKDKRAYSHGCIRLQDPTKMAEYLLKDDPDWNASKIQAAMNSGSEKYVKLKKPVPVLITYYTAWVDDEGLLNFRDDIYEHDAELAKKMFIKPL